MQQHVMLHVTMVDGTVIEELACTFDHFTALVLAFRADPDCLQVAWRIGAAATPARSAPGRLLAGVGFGGDA